MKNFTFLILLLVFLFSSCVHNYYVPHVQNVPLFKNKGELQLSGHFGGGTFTSGFDLQTALSLTDNLKTEYLKFLEELETADNFISLIMLNLTMMEL